MFRAAPQPAPALAAVALLGLLAALLAVASLTAGPGAPGALLAACAVGGRLLARRRYGPPVRVRRAAGG